ncbi:MAG: GDSL-type esterase/lipase family protein [Clostridiales bacterium]|jgi:lysophospholipase L1-like esterase|nr:GDSL-type esterase/lipase family protein [Clostridiales bacterium]
MKKMLKKFVLLMMAVTVLVMSALTACVVGGDGGDGEKTSYEKPGISGPESMVLTERYAATATDAYTVAGDGVTVTKTSGSDSIAWNEAAKKLDIAAGLAAGTYPVVLTASNGNTAEDKSLTFTLTVDVLDLTLPGIIGPTSMDLVADYNFTVSEEFTVTGDGVTVTKTEGDARITWDNATKRLFISVGLMKGVYSVTLKAGNGTAAEDKTLTFTLTVKSFKVACVGDSLTEGDGSTDWSVKSYPAQLQVLLNDAYVIGNFGACGFMAAKPYTNMNYASYWTNYKFEESQKFLPDIVIIMLGTNDAHTSHWNSQGVSERFESDYTDLVNTYKNLDSKPLVFCALISGVAPSAWSITAANEIIARVSSETETGLIDIYSWSLGKDSYSTDGIHFNDTGYGLMAAEFKRLLFDNL